MHFRFHIALFLIAIQSQLSYLDAFKENTPESPLMQEDPSYRILGIGSSCMDLLISVEDEFLSQVPGERGGSQTISIDGLNHILAHVPSTPKIATGGSCANTIKGLAMLHEKCAFCSHIGTDPFGIHFAQEMNKMGIATIFTKSSLPTSRVLCLITPDGQRTMRFCAGCSQEMSESLLKRKYFKGVQLVHLDSYTLRMGNLTKQAMQLAKEEKALVSIDASSFEIIREFHSTITEIFPQYVDILFANVDETRELTGLPPIEGCLKLQEIFPVAVVLLGKNGCLVGHKGKIIHSPGHPAELIDSTGAGDLFISGFLHGYLKGYPLEKCASLGNRLGSAVVEVQGAELPKEKWKIIQDELK